MIDPKIILALDYPEAGPALALADKVSPDLCRLKVGKELFTAEGPALVEKLVGRGFDVFLDLKYHDIPNTVQRAASAAARLGVWMLNVHALGGRDMLLAAREGVEVVAQRPFLLGVTVLTSHSQAQIEALGIDKPIPELVQQLASLSVDCGLDGVVCSAREAIELRNALGPGALLVTPGIRPEWAAVDDQERIVTPQQALADGASYLVIGRPITAHENPLEALQMITQSIQQAA